MVESAENVWGWHRFLMTPVSFYVPRKAAPMPALGAIDILPRRGPLLSAAAGDLVAQALGVKPSALPVRVATTTRTR